jgi:hypothetical protein
MIKVSHHLTIQRKITNKMTTRITMLYTVTQ